MPRVKKTRRPKAARGSAAQLASWNRFWDGRYQSPNCPDYTPISGAADPLDELKAEITAAYAQCRLLGKSGATIVEWHTVVERLWEMMRRQYYVGWEAVPEVPTITNAEQARQAIDLAGRWVSEWSAKAKTQVNQDTAKAKRPGRPTKHLEAFGIAAHMRDEGAEWKDIYSRCKKLGFEVPDDHELFRRDMQKKIAKKKKNDAE
jgi:hypothetical protein